MVRRTLRILCLLAAALCLLTALAVWSPHPRGLKQSLSDRFFEPTANREVARLIAQGVFTEVSEKPLKGLARRLFAVNTATLLVSAAVGSVSLCLTFLALAYALTLSLRLSALEALTRAGTEP